MATFWIPLSRHFNAGFSFAKGARKQGSFWNQNVPGGEMALQVDKGLAVLRLSLRGHGHRNRWKRARLCQRHFASWLSTFGISKDATF